MAQLLVIFLCEKWLFLDDIAAKTGFMVTEKGDQAFQGIFYAARFLLNERDFCIFGEAIAEPKNQKSSSFKRNQAAEKVPWKASSPFEAPKSS